MLSKYLIKQNVILFLCFFFSSILYGQSTKIDSLKTKFKKTKQDTNKVKILLNLSNEYRQNADFEQGLKFAKEATQLAKKIKYYKLEIKGIIKSGIIYDDLGKYRQAITYYEIALRLAKKYKYKVLIAQSYNDIGVAHKNLGNYPKAIEAYQNALKINEELNNHEGLAMVYNNIGTIHEDNKEYKEALTYYNKALKINRENNYKFAMATNYANIGYVYNNQQKYQIAIKYYQKALEIDLSIQDSVAIAADYADLGQAYVNIEDYEDALKYEQKSLSIREKHGENNKLPENYLQLSRVYLAQNNLEKSKKFAHKSLEMAKKTRHVEYKKDAAEQLSKVYEKMQKYQQAYKYHQEFKKFADILLNEKNTREIALREAKYDFEKEKQELKNKQKQEKIKLETENEALVHQYVTAIIGIILLLVLSIITMRFYLLKKKANTNLQLLNQEIRSINEEVVLQRDRITEKTELVEAQKEELEFKNQELLDLNEEKNLLIGVVAHDLKSPLNQIIGLITLISYAQETLPDEPQQYINMISDAVERLRAMITKILDVNAIETKQLNLNLEDVEVEKLLAEIGENFEVQAEEKDIKIHFPNLEDKNTINADVNYLRQVFENIISNAIKFSPHNRNIFLSVERNENKTLIKVTDEGLGISESDQKKLFMKYHKLSAKPTGKEDSTGLGLAIVKKFVETMNGKIYCESEFGKGATFVLEFDSV